MGRIGLFPAICLALWATTVYAQPEDFAGIVAKTKPEVLYSPIKKVSVQGTFPKDCKLIPLPDLEFTGPKPSHPFVLGNFYADGEWGVVDGQLQVISGKNAALQLAWADQFRLEGIIEQAGLGGWFLLIGWDEGRGFAISNVTMKDSGSPWFISEFRGGMAIEGRTQEYPKFEWKGVQPFELQVENNELTFVVGRHRLFNQLPLEGYSAGQIVLGTYDTRYGPRPLGVRSLKIRAMKPVAEK